MGTLPPTPILGLVLPDPGTGQPFSTAVQNGWFQGIDTAVGADRARLGAVEPYVLATSAGPGVVPSGTTAARDAFWGIPTVGAPGAAAAVALANKSARWFNTDKGYEQQYFAAFNDAGVGATTPQKNARDWGAAAHLALVPLRPSSVGAVSGTATLKGGLVDVASATVVSVNGVFSADFTDYVIEAVCVGAAAAVTPTLRLRVGGVDTAVASYNTAAIQVSGSAVSGANVTAQSAVNFGRFSTVGGAVKMHVTEPAVLRRTLFRANAYSTSENLLLEQGGVLDNVLSYDGFSIYTSPTIWTGTLRVFGVNDY